MYLKAIEPPLQQVHSVCDFNLCVVVWQFAQCDAHMYRVGALE